MHKITFKNSLFSAYNLAVDYNQLIAVTKMIIIILIMYSTYNKDKTHLIVVIHIVKTNLCDN